MAFSCHSLVRSDQEWFPSLVSWLSGHFGGVRNSRFAESTVYSFDSWQWLDSSCALGTVLVVGKHRHQGQWGLFPFGAHSLVGERNKKYANCRKVEDAGRDWREFLVGARIWKRKKIGLSWGWAGRILLPVMRLRKASEAVIFKLRSKRWESASRRQVVISFPAREQHVQRPGGWGMFGLVEEWSKRAFWLQNGEQGAGGDEVSLMPWVRTRSWSGFSTSC